MKWINASERLPMDYKPTELLMIKLNNGKVKVPWVCTFDNKERCFYFADLYPKGVDTDFKLIEWLDESNVSPQAAEPGLPTDEQILDWYAGNIDFYSPPLSAIKEFVLWLKSSAPLFPVVKEGKIREIIYGDCGKHPGNNLANCIHCKAENEPPMVLKPEYFHNGHEPKELPTTNYTYTPPSLPYINEEEKKDVYENEKHGYKASPEEVDRFWKGILTPPKKFLITAELRDLENQVTAGKISYSRMIEILNEKAEQYYSTSINVKEGEEKTEADLNKMAEGKALEVYPPDLQIPNTCRSRNLEDFNLSDREIYKEAFISGYRAKQI